MPVHGGLAIHAPTHEDGGIDEVDVTGLSGLLADDQHVLDAEVLAVAAALVHAARHEFGGADEIDAALNALAIGLTTQGDIVYRAAALNTLARLAPGIAGQVLTTGGPAANPSWAAAPPPGAHAATHETLGVDEIDVGGLLGLLANDQHVLDAEVLLVAAALVHAARHQNGGADEIDVGGLSGLLADDQHVLDAEVLLVAAALVHAARHQNGGADEISVAGLSGLLADDQHVLDAEVLAVAAALVHADRHKDGGADELDVAELAGALGSAGEIPETDGAAVSWVEPDGRYTPAVHGAAQHTDVTRELFIPATEGHIRGGTSSYKIRHPGIEGGIDLNEPWTYYMMKVPDDFVSFTSMKAVWLSDAAAGNMRWVIKVTYGAAGEARGTHSDTPAAGTTATGGADIVNVQEPANPLTLVNIALGDYLGIEFFREGTHADDTLDDTVWLFGLLFTYTAEQ